MGLLLHLLFEYSLFYFSLVMSLLFDNWKSFSSDDMGPSQCNILKQFKWLSVHFLCKNIKAKLLQSTEYQTMENVPDEGEENWTVTSITAECNFSSQLMFVRQLYQLNTYHSISVYFPNELLMIQSIQKGDLITYSRS